MVALRGWVVAVVPLLLSNRILHGCGEDTDVVRRNPAVPTATAAAEEVGVSSTTIVPSATTVAEEVGGVGVSNTTTSAEEDETCTGSRSYKCDNSTCISMDQLCDGIRNCDDGADEDSCENCTGTGIRSYKCDNSTCINMDQRCDGHPNCVDGADEDSCYWCNNDAVYCEQEQKCLLFWVKCDGKNDCRDGEDERSCGTK